MTYRYHSLFYLPLLLVLFVSCRGVPEPEDFPAVVKPVSVKILKGDKPLAGITVVLHSKGSSLHYFISGETGADGVATIQTTRGTYAKPGVPAGKYLVQLTEPLEVAVESLSMDATQQQQDAWQKEYDRKLDAIRSFPKALSSATGSPLEMEVASPPVAVEFDVGKY